jgi:predicted HicB family RNase H-like nuclease
MAVSVLEMRLRQNLRLDPEVWERIDLQRTRRAGNISRNTWITEAIIEKLLRDQDNQHPRRSANA